MKEKELFDAYLRNELSDKDSLKMIELLEADEAAGKRLVDYIQSTSVFIKTAQDLQRENPLEKQSPKVRSKVAKKKGLAVQTIIMSLAALFIFTCLGVYFLNQQENSQANSHTYTVIGSSAKLKIGFKPGDETLRIRKGKMLELSCLI